MFRTIALVTLFANVANAATIQVTSTDQEVTVVNGGDSVGGNPSGLSNANCTLGEAILSVNRRVLVDGCTVRDDAGMVSPMPPSGPVTIALTPGASYSLTQWGTTLYGPTGLPAIGAPMQGPFATTATSDIIIEGYGAVIERSAAANTPLFRLFAVAGTIVDQNGISVQARETNPLLTPAPGHLLSAGRLTLRNVTLRGGVAKGGDTAGRGGGGLGAGGAVFTAGSLVIEQATLMSNTAQGGGRIGFGQTDAGAGMGADAGAFGGGGFGGQGRNGRGGGGTVSNGGQLNGGTVMQAAGFGGGGAGGEYFSDGSARAATPGGFGGGGGASDVDRSGNSASAAEGGFGGGGGGGRSNAANGGFGGGGGSQQFFASSTSRLGGFGASNGTLDAGNNNSGGAGAGLGGAIFSTGQLAIINSTLADNAARGGGAATTAGQQGGSGFGGAIFIRNGSLQLTHATLVANQVAGGGGFLQGFAQASALYVLGDAASATIRIDNSVLVDSNIVGAAAVFIDSIGGGSVTQNNGRNWLTANATGVNALSGDVRSGAAGLGAVALAGLTPVAIPQVSSRLVNAALASSITLDQRGFTRPFGAAPDLGAVELQAVSVTNALDTGPGSLRQALLDAALLGQTELRFADNVRGAINIVSGLTLPNGINLIGPGANLLTVNRAGSGLFTILTVPTGASASLSGLSLSNGQNPAASAGSIVNSGNLTVDAVYVRAGNSRCIFNNTGARLTMRNSAVTDCFSFGAAAILNQGNLQLVNSTLANNIDPGNGGTLTNAAGATANLVNVTIANNVNENDSTNYAINNAGALILSNVILANPGSIVQLLEAAPPASTQVNDSLSTDASLSGAGISGSGNLQNTNPLLGVLQNNGGPTPTLALPGASPARDAGSDAHISAALFGPAPFVDQRGSGFARISGQRVDIGAFERIAQPTSASNTSITSVLPGVTRPFERVAVRVAVRRDPPLSDAVPGVVVVRDGPLGALLTSSCTINLSGSASEVGACQLASKRSGTVNLIAEYSGALEVLPSSSAGTAHSVREFAIQPLLFATARVGQAVAIGVTFDLDGGVSAPQASGSISVSDGAASCTIVLPASPTSCDYVALTLGAKQLTARYSGDANYPALVSAPVPIDIGPERFPQLVSQPDPSLAVARSFTGGSASAEAISADGRFVVYANGTIFLLDRRTGQLRIISRAASVGGVLGAIGNDVSFDPVISADGRFIAFASYANNLTANDSNASEDIFLVDRVDDVIRNLTADGNNDSLRPSISQDGAVVAFSSLANNLVPGDSNNVLDIFMLDLASTIRSRVSVGAAGLQANGRSDVASLSRDGRWLAFESAATNLVAAGATGASGQVNIYLRDVSTASNQLVSVASGGIAANARSQRAQLSGDGGMLAFSSLASNLVTNDNNAREDVFVFTRTNTAISRVSVSSAGIEGDNISNQPRISSDGRYVVFETAAANLAPGDSNGRTDIYRHDRQTASTTRMSVTSNGAQALTGSSTQAAVNSDGSLIVFKTAAREFAADHPLIGTGEIYLRDVTNARTEGLSARRINGSGVGFSADAEITPDGRFVVFTSGANNLLAGPSNIGRDVYLRNTHTGAMELISVAIGGAPANDDSNNAAISDDGRFVAFESVASNLVPGDSNNVSDIFLRDRSLGSTVLISGAAGVPGNARSSNPDISGDGNTVVFDSFATSLSAGEIGNLHVLSFNRFSNVMRIVNITPAGGQSNGQSSKPQVSRDGSIVVFESGATNLVTTPVGVAQIYRATGALAGGVELVSSTAVGVAANTQCFNASLSADGTRVAFETSASNLDTRASGSRQVYLRNFNANTGSRLISERSGVVGNGDSKLAVLSPDGSQLAFESAANNLVASDSNGVGDVFVLDLNTASLQPSLLSANAQGVPGNGASSGKALSAVGTAVFDSVASNVVFGDANGERDVFLALTPQSNTATRTEILSDTPDPSLANQSYSVSVRVSPSAGNIDITGLVQVSDDRGEACTAVLTGAGTSATGACLLTSTSVGVRSLSARYVGDANYGASVSSATSHTVAAAVLSGFSVIGDSPDPSRLERSVTYSWRLNASRKPDADPARALSPTGTVLVKEAASCGAPAVLAAHQCSASLPDTSCQIAFTTVGVKNTVLCYSGDASFAAASAVESHDVQAASVPVTLAWLRSSATGAALEVQFATASNLATVGFDLAADGTGERPSLAHSSVQLGAISDLLASSGDASRSQSYQLRGRLPIGGAFYLRSFDSDGSVQGFGPFTIGDTYGTDPSIGEASAAQIRFDWSAVRSEMAARTASGRGTDGNVGVYLDVTQPGIQRVSAAQLRAAGYGLFDGVPISELALSTGVRSGDSVQIQAVPIAITSSDAMWNSDDSLLFIGEPADTQATGTKVYTLNRNAALAVRITPRLAVPGFSAPIRVLPQRREHRERLLFSPTSVGASPWTWARIAASTAPANQDIVLNLSNVLPSSALLLLRLQGGLDHDGAALDHHVQVSLNGTQIADVRFDGLREFEQRVMVPAGVLRAGANTLSLRLPADTGLPSDVVLLEAIEIEANQLLGAQNGSGFWLLPTLSGNASASDTLFANGFETPDAASASVLAISGLAADALLLSQSAAGVEQLLGAVLVPSAASTAQAELHFASAGSARLFATSAPHSPGLRAVPGNADLIGPAQYLVIAHPSFIDALDPLLAARAAQGLSTKLVSTEQIYARSGGDVSPAALRDYLALATTQMGTRFVLLVGGDTFDARGFQSTGSISFVPTDYVQTSPLVRFAPSDAALVDFDHNGTPDLAIGRFPVRTQTELQQMLAKTLRPRVGNRALLIGDKPEPGLRFSEINADLAALLPNFSVQRAEREVLTSVQIRQMIIDDVNQGARMLHYLGHAGPARWSFENFLDTATLRSGALSNTQPLDVLQLACWTNYFIEPSHNTLGHAWLNQTHGARAVVGPSSLTEVAHSAALARLLLPKINAGLAPGIAPGIALGQALFEAKQALALVYPNYRDVLLGVNLLGDPAAQ
jgi:hypothetical protein